MPGNLYEHFAAVFARDPGKVAIRDAVSGATLTFGDLMDGAARYANALSVLGVEPGDRVTVQVEKSIANVLLYLGTLKVGAVYQPLNSAYTEAEVDYFVGDAEPRVIVCDPPRQQAMRNLADRRGVNAVVNLGRDGAGSLASLAAAMDTRHDTAERGVDDLAGLLYTSGTTGRSKGAMITHGNLASNAETLVKLWRFVPDDVLLHALPVFHVHGLYVALNTSFLNGNEILWFDRFDAAAALDGVFAGNTDDGRSNLLYAPARSAQPHR